MLFDSLDKIKRNAIFTTILLIALGTVILLCPENYISTIVLGLGYVLAMIALVMMMSFFSSKKMLLDYLKFTGALVLLIIGLCVLVFRNNIMRVLAWLFGFLLFLDGLRTLIHSFTYARRSHRKAWWILTILSVLMMVASVMLFLNPWVGDPGSLMKVIGTVVLFAAAISGIRLIFTWPIRKENGGKEDVEQA